MPWNSAVCIWWPTPPDAWPPRPKATVSGYWAGRAKDLQAVTDLLPELATAVERHRISMGS